MLRSPPPDVENVLVSVGADVVLEKTREEALAIIEERQKEVEKSIMSVVGQREELKQRLEADQEVLQALVSSAGQKG